MRSKSRSYLEQAIRDPKGVIFRILYGKKGLKKLSIRRLLKDSGVEAAFISSYYEEIISNTDFSRHITESMAETGRTYYGQINGGRELYVVTRLLEPSVVVETGVAAGVSSAFILKALDENNKGSLYSVDLPAYELGYRPETGEESAAALPLNTEPGFVIPNELRKRWHLKIGKSADVLPELLMRLNRLDLFIHDSEHTYENMTFEYDIAWKYLSKKGIILSHDVSWNNAFKDFCLRVKRKSTILPYLDLTGLAK